MPSTTVPGRLTSIVSVSRYSPGVSSRCLPVANCWFSVAAVSPGLAMKNLSMGKLLPGVRAPLAQETPTLSRRSAGTRTA